MGKALAKQITRMSWTAKLSLVLVCTLLTSVFMYEGWYQPRYTQAAVANSTQWALLGSSATTITALPAMTLAKPTATNRLLVVSFVGDYTAATTTFQPTITYGGQTLTRITSTDTSSRQKVWIGYLNETGIAAATTTTFAVSGVAPSSGCGLSAAIYNGVNQTTPTTGSRAVSSDTATTTPTSATIAVTAGGWAVYASNVNAASPSAPPAGFTEHFDTVNGALYQFAVGSSAIATTGTANPLPTWTSNRYAFLTAALNPAATNVAPTVSLTAPATGATFTAPATIGLTATAADTDGTITKVDFYNGATLLFSATTAPYSYSWTGVAAGSYTLTAVATDNSGATTTSTAATVTVTAANALPTVSLTAPANGATFTAPATISLTATAADTDGTIAKVDFYNGATLLFSDTAAPYSYSWTGVAAGSYSLTAVATDNLGAATTSSAATVSVATAPVTGTTTGALTFPSITATSIGVQAAFSGDSNNNNTCTIRWGAVSGAYPNTATAAKGSGVYTATVTGLTTGATYYFQATFTDADGLTGTNPVTGSAVATATPWTNSPLLHNSQNLPSAKWAAGWGVPGGQYGAFTCATCHNQSTGNIKRVAAKLPAVFAPVSTITFQSTSTPNGFGDDTGGHATSAKVCEVCHTKNKYHNFNSATNTSGLTHNNNSDCTATCHPHSIGFKAGGGACDSCHGNPPTTATSGGNTGLATNALPAGQAGAHAKHVTTKGMLCVACHNGYETKAMPSVTMDMGFAINPTNAPGFVSTVNSGSFVGNSAMSSPAGTTWVSGSTGTTVTTAAGVNTCAVYCHGSTLTPANSAASWVAGATEAACGACHGASSATPPTTANHGRHAGAAAGQLALTCDKCHGAHPDNSHVTGTVKWDLTGIAATAQYKTPTGAYATAGATTGLAPSASYGACNAIYCHSNSGPNATVAVYTTPTWGGAVLTCAGCHNDMSTIASTAPNGGHFDHASATNSTGPQYACATCHGGYTSTTVNAATHANKLVELAMTGATYTKTSPMAAGSAWGTCSSTNCHGSATNLVWGGALWKVGADDCTICHSGAATGLVTAAVPFYDTGYPTKVTANTDTKVGAHTSHVAGVDSLSSPLTCDACHGAVTFGTTTHMNGSTTFAWSAVASTGGLSPSYNGTTGVCSNVYCHGAAMPGGDTTGTARTPTWTNTLPATLTAAACGSCHGFPPPTASGHPAVTLPTGFPTTATIGGTCNCHANINTAGNSYANMFVNKALHINGIFEAPDMGDCLGCHNAPITRTKGRPGAVIAAISTEFGLAWGHKKTGRGAVTAADCVVCHLEGSVSGTTVTTTTSHMDGNIDLRDPDGAGQTPITNIAGAAFTFQRFSTSYAAGSRTSTGHTANTIDNVITQKFCLACHDNNGATNPTARAGTAPTQYLPFGTGGQNPAATYPTPGISAGIAGGVFDAKSQFATTNASFHPVMGPKTKDFPTPARLNAPYNNFTRAGTSGTKTVGVVINCFDCHNQPAVLTRRTVVAHGNAVTLRANVRVAGTTAAANLCLNCHAAPTATTGYLTSGFHGAGSAFVTGSGNMNTATQSNCYYCHGTAAAGATVNGALVARPVRAVEVHGFNDRTQGTVGSKWVNGAASHRPYAFIRNSLSYWSPKAVTTAGESVQRSNGCTGTGGTCNNNMSATTTYTVGGSY